MAAGTAADMTDPVAGIGELVPDWFFVAFLAVVVGGTITNNIIGLYSSGLDLQVMGIRLPRVQTVLIDATLATILSVYALFVFDFTSTFVAFLTLIVIWMAPWGAIYLVDMAMRRVRYHNPGLHRRQGGPYWYDSGWNIRGLVALGLGVIASGAFANSTKFRGPLVDLVGGGDLSVIAGPLVAGLTYYFLMRSVIRSQPVSDEEQPAAERRHEVGADV
jgi:purine-cytosine permease-like protein